MEAQGETSQSSHSQDLPNTVFAGASAPYSADFYIFSFKVVPCTATYAHNWSLCPFVHPNEKARRRDPRTYHYEPLPCPFDKKGSNCPHGDACMYTHNVYEYWLHPRRFRTQMCQQGAACKRPLCFFAHSLQELRFAEAQAVDGSELQETPPTGAAAAAVAVVAASRRADFPSSSSRQQPPAAAVGPGMYIPSMAPFVQAQAAAANAAALPAAAAAAGGMFAAGPAAYPQHKTFAPGLVTSAVAAQQQQQQQQWLPGYITPQGYVVLGNVQPQMMAGPPLMYFGPPPEAGGEAEVIQHQQQQMGRSGPYLQGAGARFAAQASSRAGPACSSTAAGSDVAYGLSRDSSALGSLQFDHRMAGTQFHVISDESDVLLAHQSNRLATGDSGSGYLQPSAQQQQDAGGLASADMVSGSVVSGSGYGWSLQPSTGPGTSASVSMSGPLLPAVGLSSSSSVPGSSNSSLSHARAAQQAAPATLDALQAKMQQMSMRDGCHVRDL